LLSNRGSAKHFLSERRRAATSRTPRAPRPCAALFDVRARGRAARGSLSFQAVLLPQAPRPEVWESSRPRARHGPRRTGRCAPRTASLSVAHCRTRTGRDGRPTAASPASRRRHREASAIKARAPSAFARPTDLPTTIVAATVCSRLL
jgi:hypothetical protein